MTAAVVAFNFEYRQNISAETNIARRDDSFINVIVRNRIVATCKKLRYGYHYRHENNETKIFIFVGGVWIHKIFGT